MTDTTIENAPISGENENDQYTKNGFYHGEGNKRKAPKTEQRNRKKRRTGMLTLGLSLIALGAAALLESFVGGFDIMKLLRWSPALLVLLGAEILYSSFKDGEQYRVNFWCAAMCLILSAASACAVFVPPLWEAWGPASRQRSMLIESEFTDKCYSKLKKSDVAYLRGCVDLNGATHEKLDELDGVCRFYVDAQLGEYENAEGFVKAAMPVINAVRETVPVAALSNIEISSRKDVDDIIYNLELDSRWLINSDEQTLLDYVYTIGEETVPTEEDVLPEEPSDEETAPTQEDVLPEEPSDDETAPSQEAVLPEESSPEIV